MVREEIRFTIFEFRTENSADVKPDTIPRNNPNLYWKSNENMMYSPDSTRTPITISYFLNRVLLNQGSSRAVHKEFVAKPTRLTDTFDTRPETKKEIQ